MTSSSMVTFQVTSEGIGFHDSNTNAPGLVYERGIFASSLCLGKTLPFLAPLNKDSISWDETTEPLFYQARNPLPSPSISWKYISFRPKQHPTQHCSHAVGRCFCMSKICGRSRLSCATGDWIEWTEARCGGIASLPTEPRDGERCFNGISGCNIPRTQVFSFEDDYEKGKLRWALPVLKTDNGETPPVYI
ncbi:hypothetical protein BJ741DRAFT_598823 [Chytriomyces cf. hyalinus JEL632]|nr:hypothetical protein BJ741DRAFT_598823 [Chytriomyces cf. hyalinus JEL632]